MDIEEIKRKFLDAEAIINMDNDMLNALFERIIDSIYESENEHEKEELREFLLLLEGTPELEKRVAEIINKSQYLLEEKIGDINDERQRKQEFCQKEQEKINKLEHEFEQAEKQHEEEKHRVAVMKMELDEKIKQLMEISNSEKSKLIMRQQKFQRLYNQEKRAYGQLKDQYNMKKRGILEICSTLSNIESGVNL